MTRSKQDGDVYYTYILLYVNTKLCFMLMLDVFRVIFVFFLRKTRTYMIIYISFFLFYKNICFFVLFLYNPALRILQHMKYINDLRDTQIGKSIFHIAFPSILAGILQTGFLMVSTYWMGKIGTDANATMTVV